MGYLSCGCRSRCTCGKVKEVTYPTKKNVKNTYSEETVKHIQPSHTTVVNHHTIRNEYLYPHTTSYEERVREIDIRGAQEGPFNNNVAGVMDDRGHDCTVKSKGCGCISDCHCCHRSPWRGWL